MRKASLALFVLTACAALAQAQQSQRSCAVCGSFYPENPAQLRETMAGFYKNTASTKKPGGQVVALLAPHAGYYFSGQTAAYAYSAAEDAYDTVVIIGTGHNARLEKAALNSALYKTPAGDVPTDDAVISGLLRCDGLFELNPSAHAPEHSIEVQLPLLLARLKRPFMLVPVLLNASGLDNAVAAGKAIAASLRGRKALIVVSTDLSHYPPADIARASDLTIIEAVKTLDPYYLALTAKELEFKKSKNLEVAVCGLQALLAGISAATALGANEADLLAYANAGEMPGFPPDRAVGYAAMAFVKAAKPQGKNAQLSPEQQKLLLKEARRSIAEGFANTPLSPSPLSAAPELNLPAALFVTITENDRLRGCIGTTEPLGATLDSVRYYARMAAFNDPRFPPLKEPELNNVKLEISILSRPELISSPSSITPGKHGVIVQRASRKGVFLPQVWKDLPSKEQFLNELCEQKAGMERDCWKSGNTKLYIFTDYAFSE